jgi:F0F1-type ATP synthase membrane subunit c/vacuolar-type H+-ATPase subunit K
METEYEPPFVHNQGAERANTYMVVEQSKALPLLVALTCMAMLVAGIAVGLAISARHDADAATSQARRSELRVEGFTRALIAHNIDPYPHIRGEDP